MGLPNCTIVPWSPGREMETEVVLARVALGSDRKEGASENLQTGRTTSLPPRVFLPFT